MFEVCDWNIKKMILFCFLFNKVWFMKLNDMQINQINWYIFVLFLFNIGVVFVF